MKAMELGPMFSRRRILFFMPSIIIVLVCAVWALRAFLADPAQDDRVVLKGRSEVGVPPPAVTFPSEVLTTQAMQQETSRPTVVQQVMPGGNESVYFSVFPPDPNTEPANMAEAEERMSPSAPAPGSLGAAVLAYEESPQYAAFGKPINVNISLDEALQAAREGSRPGGNPDDALLNPFGIFAK
jgi:hypothetical protein